MMRLLEAGIASNRPSEREVGVDCTAAGAEVVRRWETYVCSSQACASGLKRERTQFLCLCRSYKTRQNKKGIFDCGARVFGV